MLYCGAVLPLEILSEPDLSASPRASLDASAVLTLLAELGPWARVKYRNPLGVPVIGWVMKARLARLESGETRSMVLLEEPFGEARPPLEARILRRLIDLGSWWKVLVLAPDGTTRTGWIEAFALPGQPVPAGPATVVSDPAAPVLVLGVNEIFRDALLEAERKTGIDAAALAALVDAEASIIRAGPEKGRWNARAFNESSGAAGMTQFLRSTWLGHAQLPGTALRLHAAGRNLVDAAGQIAPGAEAALLELRFDPRLSILSAAEYGAANLKILVQKGLVDAAAPDDRKAWFMYLAHHEGPTGAQGFLTATRVYTQANLETQVGDVRAAELMAEHGGDANRAYRQWLSGYIDLKIRPGKFRGGGVRPPGGLTGLVAAAPAEGVTIRAYSALADEARARLESWAGPASAFDAISGDRTLAAAIQQSLSVQGYLDPPADGEFGPVSLWALTEFGRRAGFDPEGGFTPMLAKALADPARGLPVIRESGHWIDRVLRFMQQGGLFVCRHPACCNIVYIEGMNVDGSLNADEPNQFNDLRIVFSLDETGVPVFEAWEATTEPGDFWTFNPMNPSGAARIAFGQYKAWAVGRHLAGKPSGHEALVQTKDVVVHRDFNRDHKRSGDALDRGLFGINQHWGYDAPRNDIKNTSAGCLVGRTKDGHRDFMTRIKRDARFKASKGYRFVTAILPGDKIGA